MNAPKLAVDLRQIPVFDGLGPSVIARLNARAEWIVKPRYHYLFLPGDMAGEMYFLVEGRVKLGVYSLDYKENIREVLDAPGHFGEVVLTGESIRQGFALTMSDKNLIVAVQATALREAMASSQQLQGRMLEILGKRLREAEDRVDDLINKDARTRIIDFLRNTVRQRGRQIGLEMHLRHDLTQQDIASITGTSRQTVTQVLNELRKSNLIYFTRQSILVRDISKLEGRIQH